MKYFLKEGDAAERAEIISAIVTGFALPGGVIKGASMLSRMVRTEKRVAKLIISSGRSNNQGVVTTKGGYYYHALSKENISQSVHKSGHHYEYEIVSRKFGKLNPNNQKAFQFIHENPGSTVINYCTLESLKKLRQQVIFLLGPGSHGMPAYEAKQMFQKINPFADVSLIGDGQSHLTRDHYQLLVKNLRDSSYDKKLLFIKAHGNVDLGEHYLQLQKLPTHTGEFLRHVGKELNGIPIEVFHHSCHGGAANKYIDVLPKGSTIVSLATAMEPVPTYYANNLLMHVLLKQPSFNIITAEKLLLAYLTGTEGILTVEEARGINLTYRLPVVTSSATTSKSIPLGDIGVYINEQLNQYIPKNKLFELIASTQNSPYQDLGLEHAISLVKRGDVQSGHIRTLWDNPIATAHHWLNSNKSKLSSISQADSVQLSNLGLFANQIAQNKDKALLFALTFFSTEAEAKQSNPRCQRPYFEDAKKAFLEVNGYGNFETLSKIAKGKVKENFDNGTFRNACALRGSYALFNSPDVKSKVDCKIPRIKNETVSAEDGSQYIYRVETMIRFLTETWGPPDYDGRKEGQHTIENAKGVLIQLMPEGARRGYTGHLSVTDYFNSSLDFSRKELFWYLPEDPKQKITLDHFERDENGDDVENLRDVHNGFDGRP